MAKKLKVGDKVAYSVKFLRNIGMSNSEMARARGTVTQVGWLGEKRLIRVDWKTEDLPAQILEVNLARVGLNTEFCAC